MAELKTKEHDGDVIEFITTFANNEHFYMDVLRNEFLMHS